MIALLIIGSLTALFCAFQLYGMVSAPFDKPVTNIDLAILGIYLIATVICVAGTAEGGRSRSGSSMGHKFQSMTATDRQRSCARARNTAGHGMIVLGRV
jgi:hypothetical protein